MLKPKKCEEVKENEHDLSPKQSASVLCKYMKKLDYLKEILSNRAIFPRYYEESIEYLGINGLDKIAFPMVCFCDINFSKIDSHVEYYGEYGICLTKKWGVRKGIQPIQYVNPQSNLIREFSDLFAPNFNREMSDVEKKHKDYLVHQLLYMKPIFGQMRRNEDYHEKIFMDEREWRWIPKVPNNSELPLTIPRGRVGVENAYQFYSSGIKEVEELWLKFEIEDIVYLIVKNNECRDELIGYITELDNLSDRERLILISKIIVYEDMKKDW